MKNYNKLRVLNLVLSLMMGTLYSQEKSDKSAADLAFRRRMTRAQRTGKTISLVAHFM
jgi:hypothetical protein